MDQSIATQFQTRSSVRPVSNFLHWLQEVQVGVRLEKKIYIQKEMCAYECVLCVFMYFYMYFCLCVLQVSDFFHFIG